VNSQKSSLPVKERGFFREHEHKSLNDVSLEEETTEAAVKSKSKNKISHPSQSPAKFKSFELQPAQKLARPATSKPVSNKQVETKEEENPAIAAFKQFETPPSISEDKEKKSLGNFSFEAEQGTGI
jgi:hypothetical protein